MFQSHRGHGLSYFSPCMPRDQPAKDQTSPTPAFSLSYLVSLINVTFYPAAYAQRPRIHESFLPPYSINSKRCVFPLWRCCDCIWTTPSTISPWCLCLHDVSPVLLHPPPNHYPLPRGRISTVASGCFRNEKHPKLFSCN